MCKDLRKSWDLLEPGLRTHQTLAWPGKRRDETGGISWHDDREQHFPDIRGISILLGLLPILYVSVSAIQSSKFNDEASETRASR